MVCWKTWMSSPRGSSFLDPNSVCFDLDEPQPGWSNYLIKPGSPSELQIRKDSGRGSSGVVVWCGPWFSQRAWNESARGDVG